MRVCACGCMGVCVCVGKLACVDVGVRMCRCARVHSCVLAIVCVFFHLISICKKKSLGVGSEE